MKCLIKSQCLNPGDVIQLSECLSRVLDLIPITAYNSVMGAQSHNSITQGMMTGSSEVQGHPGLHETIFQEDLNT